MPMCHDFINGFYYEDYFTGEKISEMDYYEKELEEELRRKGQHYILIKLCESKINGREFYCDVDQWHYYASEEMAPNNVVILSENEYIKNEKIGSYYRKYKGDDYFFLEVEANVKLKADKVEKIYDFFFCTVKGRGILYTEEEFREKFII